MLTSTRSASRLPITRPFSAHLTHPSPTARSILLSRHASTSSSSPSHKPAPPRTAVSSPPKATSLTLPRRLIHHAQSTAYLTLITLGLSATLFVSYTLYTSLLAPLSPTRHFNAALSKIRGDRALVDLLGGAPVKGYGEETGSRRAFARPFASSTFGDRGGGRHLVMRFWVEGRQGRRGRVNVHVVREEGMGWTDWAYQELFVDVEGECFGMWTLLFFGGFSILILDTFVRDYGRQVKSLSSRDGQSARCTARLDRRVPLRRRRLEEMRKGLPYNQHTYTAASCSHQPSI